MLAMLFQWIRLSTCVWSLGPRGALICLIRWAGPLSRADGISSFSMFLPVLGGGGEGGAESVFLIKTCTGSWSAFLLLAPKGVSRAALTHFVSPHVSIPALSLHRHRNRIESNALHPGGALRSEMEAAWTGGAGRSDADRYRWSACGRAGDKREQD